MLDHRKTLCIIMGGGKGTRMMPLTKYRSKPAVPFGGHYRLIDVPVSNCLNSGFNKILVLTQYNSESLNKHIFRTYKLDSFYKGFVEILAAEQSYEKSDWFQGTADSVRRSLPHIHDPYIDEVIVLSGDQLYSLDLRALQQEHRSSGADITIACHPEPLEQIHQFGVMGVDKSGAITSFVEKPDAPSAVEGSTIDVSGKESCLASMGIYIFKADILSDILERYSDMDDFGREIIPAAIKSHKVQAYTHEGYWSDIGTIQSYYEAGLMLTDPMPAFDLYNEDWQFYTRPRYLPPAKIQNSRVENCIIAEGCIVNEARINRSVIGVRSRIQGGTEISESIINGNDWYDIVDEDGKTKSGRPLVGIGSDCVIKRAIIDKNVSIGDGVKIINKAGRDNIVEEQYSIRDGIVVIHKGAVIPSGTEI